MLGVGNCIMEKETRPMRTLIEASLTIFFTTMSCGGVKQIFFGIVLVYIFERKDENCKIECSSQLQGLANCIVRFTLTVLDDSLRSRLT